MRLHRLTAFVLSAAFLLAAGCGSGPAQQTGSTASSLSPRGQSSELDIAQLDAKWQQVLKNPGAPGVDYDPDHITVSYLPGARVPSGVQQPAHSAAAGMGNAIIRVNKQYEPLTDAIAARYGLGIYQQIYWRGVNVAGFELPKGAKGDAIIAAIRADFAGQIEYATYSRLYQPHFSVTDSEYNSSTVNSGGQWGLKRIGCSTAWDITRGDPALRIAVVDTGVRLTHQELTAQVLDPQVAFPSENCDVRNNDNTVEDNVGHGTFIAGLIAAQANNAAIVGVAHRCQVIPIKISNGGSAADTTMLAGCALAVQLGAKVVNLSFGGTTDTPSLRQIANEVDAAGCILCGAAGNDDTANPDYPGAYPKTLCVGSTNESDGRSTFSNKGSYVDIAAPGQDLVSCAQTGDSDYVIGDGTSFSAPITAAAAALVWTVAPGLTNTQVKQLLIDTGVPTTGFALSVVPRLDLNAALLAASGVIVKAPALGKLIQSGVFTMTPSVIGTPEHVDALLNGSLVGSLTAAPWDFSINSTGIQFGTATVQFIAYDGADQSDSSVDVLIDNTVGTNPLLENFDGGAGSFAGYDAKSLAQTPMNSLYTVAAGDQNIDAFSGAGPGAWMASGQAQSGSGCMYCGEASGAYGEFEVDTLVSKKITLGSTNPSMVLYHHYNIEEGDAAQGWDRAWVLVTQDNGATFAPAQLKAGGNAYFTGLLADWTKAEIDLSAFANKTVNIVLALESDETQSGQDTGQNSGWWVDSITIAANYNETVPTIGGVNVASFSVWGEAPAKPEIEAEVQQPDRVDRVRYILDVAPLNVLDFKDPPAVNVTGNAPWAGLITVPATAPNQLAQLKVQYFDTNNNAGPEFIIPVYIFNHPGDVNADGKVDQADTDAFPAMVGKATGDPGFVPFFDSDFDGVVTEADASAVGYFWKP